MSTAILLYPSTAFKLSIEIPNFHEGTTFLWRYFHQKVFYFVVIYSVTLKNATHLIRRVTGPPKNMVLFLFSRPTTFHGMFENQIN